jgi:hypothetical protein
VIRKILKLTLIIFFAIFLCGCEKDNSGIHDDLIVVEGYLYQGEPVDSIHITKTVSFKSSDTIYPPVDDAKVSITWNNISYNLQNTGNGNYTYSGNDLSINVGDEYSIMVIYNGSKVTSSTIVPEIPDGVEISDTVLYIDISSFFPPGFGINEGIKVSWENPDNDYFFIVIENNDPDADNIEYDTGGFPGGFTPPSGISIFRSQPFNGNEYNISSNSLKKYGKHTVKVYRVNQEYVDLYENRQQDSRNLTEPLTNIKNGLGIFTAFSYAQAYFYVKKE